jgi:hypothetical protein
MAKRDHRAAAASRGLGERLLAGSFRGLCLVLRSAAQCCGRNGSDEVDRAAGGTLAPERSRSFVDFGAFSFCGSIPLGELAAAERELNDYDPGDCAFAATASASAAQAFHFEPPRYESPSARRPDDALGCSPAPQHRAALPRVLSPPAS